MRQNATENKYQSQDEPEQSGADAMLVAPIPEIQDCKNQQYQPSQRINRVEA